MKTLELRIVRPARTSPAVAGAIAATLFLLGCSGGGSNPDSTPGTSGDFIVLRTTPPNNGRLFLNESIAMDFSNPVMLTSADLNTVSFSVFDLNGTPLTEQPQGRFEVATTPGDSVAGRRLRFSPKFPTNNTFDNGGFRPGRLYVVSLVAGSDVTTLRDTRNSRLARPISFQFSTADGTTPFELFKDTKAGGPRRTAFRVSRGVDPDGNPIEVDRTSAPLSALGGAGVDLTLEFDQPLNPSTVNVPTDLDPDPTKRAGQDRGRIYLEYDNGPEINIWIPATVTFERNALEGSTLVLRPIGVLPNNAEIRVIVESTVEDMSGESNISDTAYSEVFATFTTVPLLEPQFDALVEHFVAADNTIDFEAPILEPQAEVAVDQLTSTFAFEGQQSALDYEPSTRETILDTNFTQVAPIGSEPINVVGGVFRFRNVTIPPGRIVRGVGPNPMVWLVTGNFVVNGTLSVDGGDGDRVNTLNSANFPTPGGIGVCGGGNGGRGSPNAGDRSLRGEQGFGPGQRPGRGGFPGELFCSGAASCTGAGGGGGSFSTQGDPEFNNQATNYDQWRGFGGSRCAQVQGAPPGERPFVDSRSDNDFWGAAVNVFGGVRITGELVNPLGGAGGGGGGDKAPRCTTNDSTFANDEKGGGGGGGAGVLVIQALGKISVGAQGRISADGGNGGGGEQAGANNRGGGGGAGSGGMVILMAAGGVELERHGNAYVDNDNNFSITADGGIGEQGEFQDAEILDKYQGFIASRNVNAANGGFGGMGIVQIFVPSDGRDADNTGSYLDDRISILSNGAPVSVADKIRLLAWRGWEDATGTRRDDFGNPITVTGDGDIRPAPLLMPLPFGAQSRAQSRWIDIGAVDRESGNVGPKVVNVPVPPNPEYEFAGVETGVPSTNAEYGYAQWGQGGVFVDYPTILADTPFTDLTDGEFRLGLPAYRVRVASMDLATVPDNRYIHHRAQLIDPLSTSPVPPDLRILGHERVPSSGDSYVYLEKTGSFPTAATNLRIVAKFFDVRTDPGGGNPPLDGTKTGFGTAQTAGKPNSNVRIGFAFHVDPVADLPGDRYPASGFSPDVAALLQQMKTDGKRPTYVKWDVLFDHRFGNPSAAITPTMPTQTLSYLVLPFSF